MDELLYGVAFAEMVKRDCMFKNGTTGEKALYGIVVWTGSV